MSRFADKENKSAVNKWQRYRNGGDGCIAWAEENVWVSVYPPGSELSVWVPIGSAKRSKDEICPGTGMSYYDIWTIPNPDTGRSYQDMWEEQKKVLREALAMDTNGRFKHRLIILCWPRGEGKSYLAVLILLWKVCCWPRQDIKFCANSKEQTGHAHYKIAKDMILHSPNLLRFFGEKNVQEGEIKKRDSRGYVASTMAIVSTASGIFSNITGYAFSEIFELKNEEFFTKIDGSIRNIPNAFGVIDSTVSSKEHLLHRLYETYVRKNDPLIYFSYRFSKTGNFQDYWHPGNSQSQLNSYRIKQALNFARYFLNLWSAGSERVFSVEQVEAVNFLGAERSIDNHNRLIELIQRKHQVLDSDEKLRADGVDVFSQVEELDEIESHLWPVEKVYTLEPSMTGMSVMAPRSALETLGDLYDTDWAVLVGLDRADPLKRRTGARTIVSTLLKGLAGSRTNPNIGRQGSEGKPSIEADRPEAMIDGPSYIYMLVHVANITDHGLDTIKNELLMIHEEYNGIDSIGAERWGVFDLVKWVEDGWEDTTIDLWQPTYDRQLGAFTALYEVIAQGRWKAPPVLITGSKGGDIVLEEYNHFDHDPDRRWFGSPEKNMKYGVQDDFMYSNGWGIYGGRALTVDDFRPRTGKRYWGTMFHPAGLLGNYG